MKFPPLVAGRFVRRVNRFRVTVKVDGDPVDAHLPNSGRLTELLTLDRACWLERATNPGRKTGFDLKLVAYAGTLVSVDARLPNPLVAEALGTGRLAPFQACETFEREVGLGESRIDFRLAMPVGTLWMETKSVTLVEKGVARFPDAPTARGSRHVRELVRAVEEGMQAAVVFVVQRSDARSFAPHDEADPVFGEALRVAAQAGVDVLAWTCDVSLEGIAMAEQVRVELG